MKSYISPSRHWVVKSTGKAGTWTVERQDGTIQTTARRRQDARRVWGDKEQAQAFADARNQYEASRCIEPVTFTEDEIREWHRQDA